MFRRNKNQDDNSDDSENGDLEMKESPRKPGVYLYILPNLLTTTSMFFGYFGIISSINGLFTYSAYAIVAAAIFDQLDGRVARITGSTSSFGAQYDSLSDLISFGVSPALLLYLWALQPFGRVGWLASFIYVACTALRLARFNVQSVTVERKDFQGLPSPMAAGIVASSVLAFQDLQIEAARHWGLLTMAFLAAFVMVSNFKYRSFKDLDFRKQVPFRYLVLGVLIIVLVASRPELMLFILFVTYGALGLVFGLFRFEKNRRIRRKMKKLARLEKMRLTQEAEEGAGE